MGLKPQGYGCQAAEEEKDCLKRGAPSVGMVIFDLLPRGIFF
jgi:hypothetical protein